MEPAGFHFLVVGYQYDPHQLTICFACLNFPLLRCRRSTMPPHRLPPPPCRMKIYPARNIMVIGVGHTGNGAGGLSGQEASGVTVT